MTDVAADAHLFKPQTAVRVRWNMNTDTPLPPDEPACEESAGRRDHRLLPGRGCNRSGDAGDSRCRRRRRCGNIRAPIRAAGTDPMFPVPTYWIRPHQGLETGAGMHRFLWDMQYTPLPGGGGRGGLPIAAIAHDTAPAPIPSGPRRAVTR